MEISKKYPGCPFRTELDLSGLIRYWKTNLASESFKYFDADNLLQRIEEARELHEPITGMEAIERNSDLIPVLMSAIFPPAVADNLMMGAHIPFNLGGFFATQQYMEILPFNEPRNDIRLYTDIGDAETGTILMAYLFILKSYYGVNVDFQLPILLGVPDRNTGLEKIYKLEVDTRFVTIKVTGEPSELDQKTIAMLLENLNDLGLWKKYIRPEDFILSGFALHKLVDVTDQEMLSSIKYYLLNRDAVVCGVNFETIQQKVRSLFRLPDLRLGLVFFDGRNNIITNAGISDWNNFVLPDDKDEALTCSYFAESIYDRAYTSGKPVVIENLEKFDRKTAIEKRLLEADVKNIIIAPLVNNGNIIGMLELTSPEPAALNSINASKLTNVLPMFTAAISRVLVDLQNEVRAAIQKECTAIHPSIEWRFLQAGYEMIRKQQKGGKPAFPEIVFENVYPIFGMADVRNSSVLRNEAIRADLLETLTAAKDTLKVILALRNMPIVNELVFRVEKEIGKIEPGLASGSEAGVISFLKDEVNPAIALFQGLDPRLDKEISSYFDLLHDELRIIYRRRKEFETSLNQMNESISRYIDKAEQTAQEIIPHYFEQYKTDGLEYNIYVGQSILENGNFNELYLQNFRLWQLITMCDIAKNTFELKDSLPYPLEIAQLILVHSEPLAIRFRQDEKRFDVDGAYNIRYEIVKKRIDKAHIKDTGERLTQPGKISIVYAREQDAAEYRRYIDYLRSHEYISGDAEFLELEDLQGAKGLQALRVSVNLERNNDEVSIDELISELQKA